MEEYIVIKPFNDTYDNGKHHSAGDKYMCDIKRARFLMGDNKKGDKYIKKIDDKIKRSKFSYDEN